MPVVDYELPKVERLIGPVIAEGLVKPNQYGIDRVAPYQMFNELDPSGEVTAVEAHDYIVFSREGGYMVDDHTKDSVIGLRIDCWAKTRSRAEDMMNEVVKRVIELEGQTLDGFDIDYVESLRGPEEDKNLLIHDERVMTKDFELHIGAKWIRK